eukprot:3480170-Rhodomonas_salina.1
MRSSTELHCVSPSLSAGTGSLTLNISDGLTTTTSFEFVFVDAPSVENLHPRSGSVHGGSAVMVYGAGFEPNPACRFGDNRATTATLVSSTTIMCTSPMVEAPGSVWLSVSNGADE